MRNRARHSIVLLALLVCSVARAQEPPDACALSFPERLADAKRALAQSQDETAAYERSGARAAAEWFGAHCRFLEPLELAIRKLDDPNAFVCDPKAKGRPKRMTYEMVVSAPSAASQLQNFRTENRQCEQSDRAARIALVGLDELGPLQQLELLCYADDRASCVKAREVLERARRNGKM